MLVNDRCGILSYHNCPLYVIAKVRDVELKRTMFEGSSLNIISLPILEVVSVPRENIIRQRSRCQGTEVIACTP